MGLVSEMLNDGSFVLIYTRYVCRHRIVGVGVVGGGAASHGQSSLVFSFSSSYSLYFSAVCNVNIQNARQQQTFMGRLRGSKTAYNHTFGCKKRWRILNNVIFSYKFNAYEIFFRCSSYSFLWVIYFLVVAEPGARSPCPRCKSHHCDVRICYCVYFYWICPKGKALKFFIKVGSSRQSKDCRGNSSRNCIRFKSNVFEQFNISSGRNRR